ncbi:Uncharacterized conserved protein, DUF952 family [Frankineae bacterium MT45]|nr:Uncharacterized conserved protein, DUF952 family [Frankineae bacterium MT45]
MPGVAQTVGMRILHLASRAAWESAVAKGEYSESTRDASLAEVGFIHASTASQVEGVLARHYADADLADFLLLVVDVASCEAAGSAMRWDPVGDTSFPHFYGPIPVAAVVAQVPLSRDAAGVLRPVDLTGLDVVATPPTG